MRCRLRLSSSTRRVQSVVAGIAGPYASHWLKAIGLITVLARMRSLRTPTT
jgi:hypothetical protein